MSSASSPSASSPSANSASAGPPSTSPSAATSVAARSYFDLPHSLRRKNSPELIAHDERRFAAIASALRHHRSELRVRLDALRRAPGGHGEAALERDTAIHRLTAQLRMLQRFDVDACLGRMVLAGEAEPVYIGRIGLAAQDGTRLLVDWRTPAAAPFFSATLAHPEGLLSRRRYRWTRRGSAATDSTGGTGIGISGRALGPAAAEADADIDALGTASRVSDYWDEAFMPEAASHTASATASGTAEPPVTAVALDDQSAFIESLGAARSPRMRDVLATIQADQDAIIRSGAEDALVVDGGPGTGKTVVALHRAAYLLYSRPRIAQRGGVLVIGPHRPYLDYVADVLPSLGEDGVRMCTLPDMVPDGGSVPSPGAAEAFPPERDTEVARIKAGADPARVLEAAVRMYEEPPTQRLVVETPWADLLVDAAVWQEAFEAAEAGTPHNEAQPQVWSALVEILHDRLREAEAEEADEEVAPLHLFRRALTQEEDLRTAFARAWPMLDPLDIAGDLWSVPAYARMCMPWLTQTQATSLRRDDPRAWTVSDVPFLDAAHRRIGDPQAAGRARRQAAAIAAQAEERERVAEHLIAADDSDLQLMSMLRGQDMRGALEEEPGDTAMAAGELAGPFAHIIVDEAQELTDAEWHMVLTRCPSHSLTIVGDRAQARHGFAESWEERLSRVGLDRLSTAHLSVNYRTPAEVMAEAAPVIRAVLPHANVPTSVREAGEPVRRAGAAELEEILEAWLREHPEGTACVITGAAAHDENEALDWAGSSDWAGRYGWEPRVRLLTPETAKGLEFDLVVLVDPDSWGEGVEGAVDRYVAMTRSTRGLVLIAGD